ncbi:MAG TPA: PEGA domain-containing protein, partial [Labilithrix sp.]|nr:PEGA domain-containing protein [Labilithrix sp.]
SQPPPPTTFVLHLESTPPGASVLENGRPVGVTPLDIPIERWSVTSGQRTFEIRKDGYATMMFAQGSMETNVATELILAPGEARTNKAPARGARFAPAIPPGETDIRLKR